MVNWAAKEAVKGMRSQPYPVMAWTKSQNNPVPAAQSAEYTVCGRRSVARVRNMVWEMKNTAGPRSHSQPPSRTVV